MILILVALIAITALAFYGASKDDIYGIAIFSNLICPIIAFFGICFLLAYCFLGFQYIAAGHKAEIINREYKTNYTQEEVFYASDVINTVRELDRKRVEINGNILKDK